MGNVLRTANSSASVRPARTPSCCQIGGVPAGSTPLPGGPGQPFVAQLAIVAGEGVSGRPGGMTDALLPVMPMPVRGSRADSAWRPGLRECEMTERLTLPVLPLRDVVLFPGVTTPIGAGRPGDPARHRGRARDPGEAGLRGLPAREHRQRHPGDTLHHRDHRPDRPDAARAGRDPAAAPRRAPRHRHARVGARRATSRRSSAMPRSCRRSIREDPAFVALYPRGADPGPRAGPEVRPAGGGRQSGPQRRQRPRPVRRPGQRLHRHPAPAAPERCWRPSRWRNGSAGSWCTCSARSRCSMPRRRSSRRCRRSWASGSARCSCASS